MKKSKSRKKRVRVYTYSDTKKREQIKKLHDKI